jgi:tRNA (cytidine/uridine-2'-O-)-methyltransferase
MCSRRMVLRLALYQPDIAGNVGTLVRFAACLNIGVDIIEPCGFPFTDKAFQRAGMDYVAHASLTRHVEWTAFEAWRAKSGRRLLLLTTKASAPYTAFEYRADDILLMGRESAGVPEGVHKAVDARLTIPLQPEMRSLNVALAAAMVMGEALRQTETFPT